MAQKAKKNVIEAARAAGLAAHSAAGLATASSFREAARLLRAAEALARSAVAVLDSSPPSSSAAQKGPDVAERSGSPSGAGDGTQGVSARRARRRGRRSPKKKDAAKSDLTPMDVEVCGDVAWPPAGGGSGEALSSRRLLVRHETLPATPSPISPSVPSSPCSMPSSGAVGVLTGLVGRSDLNGMEVRVVRFDASSGRLIVEPPDADPVRVKPEHFLITENKV